MLVLTRKVGQCILIGDDIEVIVQEVRGQQVVIGVVAPKGVPIRRQELRARPRDPEDP